MTQFSNFQTPEHDSRALAGKVAVVTGASSGIGQAIAVALAKAGAEVVVHYYKNAGGAEKTIEIVKHFGVKASAIQADLSIPEEQDRLVQAAWQIKPVDVWMNNAGVDVLTGAASAWSFEEKMSALWKVDVVATMRLSRAVGKLMVERGQGSIINMGWDQAEHGMEGESGEMFAAVKGAVMAFTKSLAKSLSPNVRVNAVAPGWVHTKWGEHASEAWQARAKHEALLKRWGTTEDVARAVRFLASSDAAFINGQVLKVNGGFAGTWLAE